LVCDIFVWFEHRSRTGRTPVAGGTAPAATPPATTSRYLTPPASTHYPACPTHAPRMLPTPLHRASTPACTLHAAPALPFFTVSLPLPPAHLSPLLHATHYPMRYTTWTYPRPPAFLAGLLGPTFPGVSSLWVGRRAEQHCNSSMARQAPFTVTPCWTDVDYKHGCGARTWRSKHDIVWMLRTLAGYDASHACTFFLAALLPPTCPYLPCLALPPTWPFVEPRRTNTTLHHPGCMDAVPGGFNSVYAWFFERAPHLYPHRDMRFSQTWTFHFLFARFPFLNMTLAFSFHASVPPRTT